MAIDAGTLEVRMLMGLARLQQDVTQAKDIVGRGMAGIESAAASAKTVLGALGATLSVGFFASLIKGSIDSMDRLNDLSKTTRISAEDLAGLSFAAKQSGTDLEGAAASINKLATNMGKNAEKFAALGISTKDPIEAFKQLADVTNAMNDPQQRAAVLADALGKSWQSAAPLLAEGGAKIGEMVTKGREMSGVTKELVEQADAFNDKMVELSGNGGKVNTVLAQMLPLLNATADGLLEGGKSLSIWEVTGKVLTEILRAVVVLGGNVAFVLKAIANEAIGISTQLVALAHGDLKGFIELGKKMKADAEANRKAFDQWEEGIMAVGTTAKATNTQLDAMDQVSRRMASDAAAAGRAFLEGEKAKRDAEAAAKKAAADALRLRELDERGWVAYIEALTREYEDGLREEAKLTDQFYAHRKKLQDLDDKGWVEKIEADIKEYENGLKQMAEKTPSHLETIQRQWDTLWGHVSDVAGNFFSDLVMNGKSAFDNLRKFVKQLLAEMIALFAKRWVLNMAAGGSVGGSAADALLGGVGGNSLGGTALNWAGNAAASYFGYGALGTVGQFAGAFTGAIPAGAIGAEAVAAGVGVDTLAASAGQWMAGLGATGWGLIIVAAVAVIAAFMQKHGGPKAEGSYSGTIGPDGTFTTVPGANPFNYAHPSEGANAAMAQAGTQMAQAFTQALASFGVSSGGFQLSGGVVKDPSGDAQTFLDFLLKSPSGATLLQMHNDQVGRSDEEMSKEMALQLQRGILAALQSPELQAELSPALAAIFNSVIAATATEEDLQKVFAAAQQFQSMWAGFQNMFMTDAERVAAAQEIVDKAFAEMGFAVPKDIAGFKALAQSLYEAGDVENLKKIFAVADAFKFVADASQAAADELQADWERVLELTGRGSSADPVAAFEAANPWAAGKNPQQLIADLMTISEEDFKNYSAENRKLILAILDLAPAVEENTAAVHAMTQAIVFPEREASSLQADFQNKYGGLIGAQPNMAAQLSLGITLMEEQIGKWQTAMVGLSEYSAEFQTYAKAIEDFQKKIGMSRDDLVELTILTAQYGQGKAEELLNLKHWFDQQKALVGDSQEALLALDKTYADKRKAILEGSIGGLDSFRDWWKGLFQNEQLSPLTLRQRFDLAKTDYDKALAGGDAGKIQSAAQLALELGRQLLGPMAYNAFFAQIASQTAAIAGISQGEVNQRLYGALPTSGTIAGSTDINMLARVFVEEIRSLASAALKAAADTQTAIRESGAKIADARVKEGAQT